MSIGGMLFDWVYKTNLISTIVDNFQHHIDHEVSIRLI